MAELTPMMQQYVATKEKYKDCILFYRLGDFYELFFDDALQVSKELELTLTGRDCGLEERAPMCGVPYHAVNTYLEKLIANGHKVAICEQMEDPALAKGLVERDVIRVYTPGTLNDPGMLDDRTNCYLMAVAFSGDTAGISFADVSTGEFFVYEIRDPQKTLADECARIMPKEVITSDREKLKACGLGPDIPVSDVPAAAFQYHRAADTLKAHFGVQSLSSLGLFEDSRMSVSAAGGLLYYLNETQKNALEHLTSLKIYQGQRYMLLDRNTRRNLELTESIRTRQKKGSLLWLLDHTETAMGGRLLRSWIEQPLVDRQTILRRLDAVEELTGSHIWMMTIAEKLKGVYDMERLLSKVAYKSLNARDCLALLASLDKVPEILTLLKTANSEAVKSLAAAMDPLSDLTDMLRRAIDPDAPLQITEGNIIAAGYSAELDDYRGAATNGRSWILNYEQQERQSTGIKNLRIQYNRVFGYCIEVTKSFYELVPDRYQRRQTLASSERYTTPELKEIEQKIIGAQEQAVRLEQELFAGIRDRISGEIARIQQTALSLKTLDALLSLAKVALENHYVRPVITEDGTLDIIEGRHPVVEQMVSDTGFVPNDTHMDQNDARMLIITGPNMAGKSTYMRQVALIVLMAHLGSFVPAESASIPVVDRIFTRVGASDDLAGGQSTFMVEMAETAYILRNATKDSLIILDEIGRGTSTFDGLAIAWSVVEYLADPQKIGAKTLFATHYHELSELEGHISGVQNYCISVREHGEDVIFLRKIIRGGADKSFGIHVARLAGLPHPVLVRAHEIQARLEVSDINQNTIGQNILGEDTVQHQNEQVDLFDYKRTEIIEELQSLDIMALTPMDAINKLFLLREKARNL